MSKASKKTRKPKFDYYEIGEPMLIANPSIWVHTCCGCQLRHIFYLEARKDKKESYILLRAYPDTEGTKAFRFIERLNESK